MKKVLLTLALMGAAILSYSQPKLTKDNIEEVLKAMTVQEKATLLVGGARAAIVEGVPSGGARSGRKHQAYRTPRNPHDSSC